MAVLVTGPENCCKQVRDRKKERPMDGLLFQMGVLILQERHLQCYAWPTHSTGPQRHSGLGRSLVWHCSQSLTLLSLRVWESHHCQAVCGAQQVGSRGASWGKQSLAPTWGDDTLRDAGCPLPRAHCYTGSGSAGPVGLCTDQTALA